MTVRRWPRNRVGATDEMTLYRNSEPASWSDLDADEVRSLREAERSETWNRESRAMWLTWERARRAAARSVDWLGEAIYKLAETMYLENHKRLPGSLRTRRLRKKRRSRVLGWFVKNLSSRQAEVLCELDLDSKTTSVSIAD